MMSNNNNLQYTKIAPNRFNTDVYQPMNQIHRSTPYFIVIT